MSAPDREREIVLPGPLLLREVLRHTAEGRSTGVWADGGWWRASHTPEGPVSLRIEQAGEVVRCAAWGPGADWALEQAPELLGLADDPGDFVPPAPLADAWRRHPGLRLTRTRRVLEALMPTILAQKVTTRGARRSWAGIVARWGEPAPGPTPVRLPPRPEVLADLGYAALHPLGVERRRAETLIRACRRARRLEEASTMAPAEAMARLQALPGVGPWTAAHVCAVALGDPDAVPVGDYHLPNAVAWVLAGEARAGDRRMLELLEPWSGQRGRVLRLVGLTAARAPRFGPPLAENDIRGR